MKRILLIFLASIFPGIFLLPVLASVSAACTVCFGASVDFQRGFFWGIIILLALPFGLMALLAGFIVRSSRKNRLS